MGLPDDYSLIPRATLEDFVREYQRAEKDIRDGFALVARGLKTVNQCTYLPRVDSESPRDFIADFRRQAWRGIIDRLQLRRMMSVKAWNEFDQKIRHDKPPELSIENIEGSIAYYQERLSDMTQEAVKEVFELLRPRRSTHKTNSEFEIGPKVILRGVVYRGFNRWDVNTYHDQDLIALENVLSMLAGTFVRETHTSYSQISLAIKKISLNVPCRGETEYVHFAGFGCGTLHLKFKNMDLITQLNAIAGGKRLKQA